MFVLGFQLIGETTLSEYEKWLSFFSQQCSSFRFSLYPSFPSSVLPSGLVYILLPAVFLLQV